MTNGKLQRENPTSKTVGNRENMSPMGHRILHMHVIRVRNNLPLLSLHVGAPMDMKTNIPSRHSLTD